MNKQKRMDFTAALYAIVLVVSLLSLGGCSTVGRVEIPEEVLDTYGPDTPIRNITAFTPALTCMDEMLHDLDVETIYITTAPIPDFSESRGSAGYGAREMLISAISKMSRKSGAVRYVAYDRSTPDIIALNSVHPKRKNFRAPDFFIRGAITQIDNSPWSKQKGYSVNAETVTDDVHGTGLSTSDSAELSTVSLDLNMGMVSTYEILPGISSANSLSVSKSGNSDEVSLSFWKVGAIYSINEHQATAMSTALRTLAEVGVVELIGELYDIPYWQCLAKVDSHTPADLKARAAFSDMNRIERMDFIAGELRRQRYLKGQDFEEIQDKVVMADDFRAALAHYRSDHNLFGNTLVNFRLFVEIYQDSGKPLHYLIPPSSKAQKTAADNSIAPEKKTNEES